MSNFKKTVYGVTVSALLVAAGCAHVPFAREVKKKPNDGGVIALRSNHLPEDRAKADSLMQVNCNGKEVKVTEEGEVTVGTRTSSSASAAMGQQSSNSLLTFGMSDGPALNSNSSSETSAVKEWQISYKCLSRQSSNPTKIKRG